MERVELHIHTKMSQMDGINSCEDYIKKAMEYGMTSLAITDHAVVQAFPEAQEYLEKIGDNEFKVIYGMEGYYTPSSNVKDKSYHISILVKNKTGLRNLYKIVSISNLNYFYKRPRILKELLKENREGLLIGSACNMGELQQAIIKNKTDEELEQIANNYDYLEVQPVGNNYELIREGIVKDEKALEDINIKKVELGAKLNKLVVATSDTHFLNKEDDIYRKILQARQGYEYADEQAPLYFRTTEEMLKEFEYLGKEKAYEVVVTNTNKIADMCDRISPIPKERCYPHIAHSESEICEITYYKAYELYEVYSTSEGCFILPEFVKQRLYKELDSIIENDYSSLYMIYEKLVEKSKKDGYIVGTRGAVGSSLVAYLLGVTEVNPLPPHYRCNNCKYSDFTDYGATTGVDLADKECPNCGKKLIKEGMNIPFETFAGLNGEKEPDIVLNFSGEYQAKAQEYVKEIMKTEDSFINEKCSKLLPMIYNEETFENMKKGAFINSISVIRDMIYTLGLIVEQERKIQNFKQIPYYKIIGNLGDNKLINAEWNVQENSIMFNSSKLYKNKGFDQENEARRFINSINCNTAKVINIEMSNIKEYAPRLFNLEKIQKECIEKFELTSKEIDDILQDLYKRKLITNPKTEIYTLPTTVAESLHKNLYGILNNIKDNNIETYINKIMKENYIENITNPKILLSKYINREKTGCAIIPTGEGFEEYDDMPNIYKEVYMLIVERFLAIFYPYAEYKKIKVTMSLENEEFSIVRKVCIKEGFLEVLDTMYNLEQDGELEFLNSLKEGQDVTFNNFSIEPAERNVPERYNSGSIILAMEGNYIKDESLKNIEIGTYTTRAETILLLENLHYINIDKKTQIITLTEKGEEIYNIVEKTMPEILDLHYINDLQKEKVVTVKAGTVGTLADTTAVEYVKEYYEERGMSIHNSIAEKFAKRIMGIKRTTGYHPRSNNSST